MWHYLFHTSAKENETIKQLLERVKERFPTAAMSWQCSDGRKVDSLVPAAVSDSEAAVLINTPVAIMGTARLVWYVPLFVEDMEDFRKEQEKARKQEGQHILGGGTRGGGALGLLLHQLPRML